MIYISPNGFTSKHFLIRLLLSWSVALQLFESASIILCQCLYIWAVCSWSEMPWSGNCPCDSWFYSIHWMATDQIKFSNLHLYIMFLRLSTYLYNLLLSMCSHTAYIINFTNKYTKILARMCREFRVIKYK